MTTIDKFAGERTPSNVIGTVYLVHRENDDSWIKRVYADLDSALLYTARDYHGAKFFPAAALTWRDNGDWWDLLYRGKSTGVIVQASTVWTNPENT